ncbi:hypothetical protein C0Q70_10732 [Pomacea canaliculata]|uniref:Retrotransposon gag domain-containing protein n=1 Tax=Pomacea canaliculata TaxID=400727 RepID=A0A2T7P3Z4_POMCA|nr:hypothetical protein C0Q70_10732 [Pomacea canaliculata]
MRPDTSPIHLRCASKLDKDDEAVQVSALIYTRDAQPTARGPYPARGSLCHPARETSAHSAGNRHVMARDTAIRNGYGPQAEKGWASLIYTMGNDAERILTSFGLDARQRQEYDTVLEKFDEYFVPKRNIIHERARFHARNQKPDESIEEYIRDLYELAAKADVRDKDEAIRDRLVLGILDRDLSERLQLKADLTLQDAILQARQYEQVKAQLSDHRRTNVDAVQFKKSASGGAQQPEQSSSKPSPVQNDFSLYTSQVPVTGEPETALHVSDPIQCPESTSSQGGPATEARHSATPDPGDSHPSSSSTPRMTRSGRIITLPTRYKD